MLAENFLGLGSGSGSRRFRKSAPDPVKNRPDPQHCIAESTSRNYRCCFRAQYAYIGTLLWQYEMGG
jgi:hypothetical protein